MTCTGYASCHCKDCLPDVSATPALDRCTQCTNLKPVNESICGECHSHNVTHTARVERAMKVAAFGEGRC